MYKMIHGMLHEPKFNLGDYVKIVKILPGITGQIVGVIYPHVWEHSEKAMVIINWGKIIKIDPQKIITYPIYYLMLSKELRPSPESSLKTTTITITELDLEEPDKYWDTVERELMEL